MFGSGCRPIGNLTKTAGRNAGSVSLRIYQENNRVSLANKYHHVGPKITLFLKILYIQFDDHASTICLISFVRVHVAIR